MQRFGRLMASRVPGESLAAFRVGFGLVMVFQAIDFFLPKYGPHGNLIQWLYTSPNIDWHLPYVGFSWIRPIPEPGTSLLVIAFGLSAMLVSCGFFFRFAAPALFLSFTYIWMMDAAWYLNHFYLASLLAFLLCWMPASNCFSLDAWRRSRGNLDSVTADGAKDGSIPFWPIFLLRAQLFIVYFYAGIAKLNADWLAGEPVRTWFLTRSKGAYLGNFLNPVQMELVYSILGTEPVIWFVVLGGLLFDLAVGFLLCVRRTRILGLLLVFFFHGMNFFLFDIGIFPAMAVSSTLIFLEPDWPSRVWRWIQDPIIRRPDWGWFLAGALAIPFVGAALGWKLAPTASPVSSARPARSFGWGTLLLLVWLSVQILVPLRHWAIPGDVHWTGEGTRFSWMMMLRSLTGFVQFRVVDPGILSVDEEGKKSFDWSQWQGPRPPVEFQELHAAEIDWRNLPKVLVTYEPIVGERIFFNPFADGGDLSEESIAREVQEIWRKTYGRRPRVFATLSIDESFAELEATLRAIADRSKDDEARAMSEEIASLRRAADRFARLEPRTSDWYLMSYGFQERIQNLGSSGKYSQLLLKHLLGIHPFAFQGAKPTSTPIYWIVDESLAEKGINTIWRLKRESWKGSNIDYIDLETMTPVQMSDLPDRMAVHAASGNPFVLWNMAPRMRWIQMASLGAYPLHQHQFARHVAGIWEAEYGRRPQVHAYGFLHMNDHPLQRVVDPVTDLAAVSATWFWHNDWILPKRYSARAKVEERLTPRIDP